MGDHHDGAVEVVQQRAEPLAARHVQVRLGLVEQQHVGAPREAGGERDELALAAGELARRHARARPVDAERAQVAERLALGAVAAGLGPAREQRARGGRARGVIASRSAASAGSASRASAACSSASSIASSGRAARTVASGSRSSPSTICGRCASTSPRRRVTVAGVGVLEAGEDAHQRRLAAAVGAEDADPRARLDVEIGAAQDRAPAEGLGEAAGGELRHGRHVSLASRLAGARRQSSHAAPHGRPDGTSDPRRPRRARAPRAAPSRTGGGTPVAARGGRGASSGPARPDELPELPGVREVGAAAVGGHRAVGRARPRHARRHVHDARPAPTRRRSPSTRSRCCSPACAASTGTRAPGPGTRSDERPLAGLDGGDHRRRRHRARR